MRVCPGWACCLLLAIGGASAGPAEAWNPVHNGAGVRVEQRQHAGSPLQEVRGRTRLCASMGSIMDLLQDADFNDRWVYRSGGARILARDGDSRAYVYGVVDAPWPMQDRDTVVRFDARRNAGTGAITITITNEADYVPPVDGLVRVPEFGGFWELRPQPDDAVLVTYQVYGHPGGVIPIWLANRAAARSVLLTLRNMPAAVRRYEPGGTAREAELRCRAAEP